ncbi:partial General stress protein 16U, partial [uncultured bacterium]
MVKLLKKGETIALNNLVANLQDIVIVKKWQALNETDFDIDSSAFLLTTQNKVRQDADFIFYNQPASNNQAVLLKNNAFKVSLNRLDNNIDKISFVLSIHNADLKKQHFGLLKNISIEVFNFADKQKIASYSLTDASIETAIILGVLYRYQSEWKFRAIGQGYTGGLAQL